MKRKRGLKCNGGYFYIGVKTKAFLGDKNAILSGKSVKCELIVTISYLKSDSELRSRINNASRRN